MGQYKKIFEQPTDCVVSGCDVYQWSDFEAGQKPKKMIKIESALWDTGATQTLISKRVIDALELEPIGKCKVEGYDGESEENLYIVHIGLPTRDVILDVMVTETIGKSYDVVLGMDIINKGDFCLIQKAGKTEFSFELK